VSVARNAARAARSAEIDNGVGDLRTDTTFSQAESLSA
jgi:hypothetical protein